MAAYNWKEKAEQESQETTKLPAGQHRVTITRILDGSKQNKFKSSAGDPQIMVIFADAEGREAASMYTLSMKAGWVLAKLLSSFDPPANLQRMEEDGVEPIHFEDMDFAQGVLLKRSLVIDVVWPEGGKYPDVTPVKSTQAAPPANTAPPTSPPPSPAPPTAPPAAPSPPTAPPATAIGSKAEAWEAVVVAWSENEAPTADAERNKQWLDAIAKTQKTEANITAAEWQEIADNVALLASIPF